MLSREERAELEADYKLEPSIVSIDIRTLYFRVHGTYADDATILTWYNNTISYVQPTTRGDGGSTSYYTLPTNATELGHLIRHKNMSHAIGEAFCALYRLDDNGERKRNLTKAKYYIEQELLYT